MKIAIWLLDVNYEVVDHQPEVRLWGIDDKGNRALILDGSLLPYLYLLVGEGGDPNTIADGIRKSKEKLPFIDSWEIVERRFFGRPVKAVKVVCRDPEVIPKYSAELRKISGVEASLEDDIRFSMRYLIDKEVEPCSWLEIDIDEEENVQNLRIGKVYRATSAPVRLERHELPKLKVMGFTLTAYGKKGAPKADKDPIVVISAASSNGGEAQFVAEGEDDRVVLLKFMEFVNSLDPDVIVGYGTSQNQWPYLVSRAEKHGLSLSIDRGGGTPHTSLYGHISVTGRANIDLQDFGDEFPQVKVKTLENIADFLGVLRIKDREIIDDIDIPHFWENGELRSRLLKYSRDNLRSIIGISEILIDYVIQLSGFVGIPPDYIGAAATGFKVDWYLVRHAHKIGELVPSRREQPYFPYEGGLVMAPRPGIHDNVAVLDFKSMYPSIMISKNISPDTYIRPDEPDPPEGVFVAPEVGHRFRRSPPGFYRVVLEALIEHRDELRKKLKGLIPGSIEHRMLDAQQKAVKVITNAAYGYTGWLGARWYLKPVAEATAAWGRHTINSTIEFAKEIGLEIIYGDTDSIFVVNDPSKVEELSRKVEEDLKLEIRPDTIYRSVLFTETKKRYCGLLPDGRLDVVGLEVIRGDWAKIAKDVQEEVLGILLREKDIERAAATARRFISDLRERKVPYRDLIIWKTLTKPIGEYKVKAAHVEAAAMLEKAGWGVSIGDKVGYVVTIKGGKLYEKAKPYNFASYDEIDLNYYVENQIKPAALRILEQFGVSEERLMPQ